MSQRRKLLSPSFFDEEITAIIGNIIELSDTSTLNSFNLRTPPRPTPLFFIDSKTGLDRFLSINELVKIRDAGLKGGNAKIEMEAASSQTIGGRWRPTSLGRDQYVAYANLMTDETYFEQLKKYYKKNDESNAINSNADDSVAPLPFLDPNHPKFSTEVYTIVNMWMYLYGGENEKSPAVGVKTRVERRLKEQQIDTVGDKVTQRIATAVTPDYVKTKRGTPLSIQYKKK